MTPKGKPRGRNGGRKAPYGPTERMYVATLLASIIREKGTGWVLDAAQAQLANEVLKGELEKGK